MGVNWNQKGKPQMENLIRKYSMSDVQTREKTLMELHELWSTGLRLALQGYQTATDRKTAQELETALELLTHHLKNDFEDYVYGRVINDIPAAKDLPDYISFIQPVPGTET